MKNKYYSIKDNKIVGEIDVCPFSKTAMDKFCEEMGFDGWFVVDKKGALKLMGLGGD